MTSTVRRTEETWRSRGSISGTWGKRKGLVEGWREGCSEKGFGGGVGGMFRTLTDLQSIVAVTQVSTGIATILVESGSGENMIVIVPGANDRWGGEE